MCVWIHTCMHIHTNFIFISLSQFKQPEIESIWKKWVFESTLNICRDFPRFVCPEHSERLVQNQRARLSRVGFVFKVHSRKAVEVDSRIYMVLDKYDTWCGNLSISGSYSWGHWETPVHTERHPHVTHHPCYIHFLRVFVLEIQLSNMYKALSAIA